MREAVIENEFVRAVHKAGGVAYKLTSQTTNGLPDRLVLFFPAKTVFVELKAPGKVLRPLQRKRRYQLKKLGFPVICIDGVSQIGPAIQAILSWIPGEPFPEGIGAEVPELDIAMLPEVPGREPGFYDMGDLGETLEAGVPSDLAGFFHLDRGCGDGGNDCDNRDNRDDHDGCDNCDGAAGNDTCTGTGSPATEGR